MAKSYPYIVVHPDLTVSINPEMADNGISVPTNRKGSKGPLSEGQVHINGVRVLFGSEQLRHSIGDVAANESFKKRGKGAVPSVYPPDPWLLALIWLMWEGVVQGATWDIIKASLSSAISTLQQNRLAPSELTASTQDEFSFEGYIELGTLFKVYCSIKSKKQNFKEHPKSLRDKLLFIPSIDKPPVEDDVYGISKKSTKVKKSTAITSEPTKNSKTSVAKKKAAKKNKKT